MNKCDFKCGKVSALKNCRNIANSSYCVIIERFCKSQAFVRSVVNCASLNLDEKVPRAKERLARVDIISASILDRILVRDVEIQVICEHLTELYLIRLRDLNVFDGRRGIKQTAYD